MNTSSPLTIGRLSKVHLREVWKHEAHDFTAWLAENLDILRDAIGFDLTFVERERGVGTFSADIVAEDPAGRTVIIENQLEQTDHDHLGKMITYMSNLDASAAIWITSNPRPEHEKAVQWLNEFLPRDLHFYLLQIEAVRIGDSPAAPMIAVVAGPTDISAAIGEAKKEVAERHTLRKEFWTGLLDKARLRTTLHSRISPSNENWLSAGAGMTGLGYNYVLRTDNTAVEFYIDAGDQERNKQIFDRLIANREQIESRFGASLNWQRLDSKRASRITFIRFEGGLRDSEQWPKFQDAMVDDMIRLEHALKPELASIR